MTTREAIRNIKRAKCVPYKHQTIATLIRSLEENKALRMLVEWAVECGFGYDNFPEEYEKYKDEIKDMGYIDGMIYIAMKEVEE